MSNHWAKAMIVVIAIIALAIIATACGPAATPTPAAAPKVIAYGMLEEPDMLDPYATNMSFAVNASNLFYDGLVKPNDKLELVPWLAEEVPTLENGGISADFLTITYKLRKGVKWHDGTELTCQDVKATWELIMNPDYAPVSRVGYDKIDSVDCSDPYKAVFHLKEVYAPFVNILFQYAIYPKSVLDKIDNYAEPAFRRNPMGTGPFKFDHWTAGEELVAVKNPDYFLGEPKIDKVILRMAPDDQTLLAKFQTGEIQIWEMVPPTLLDQVKAVPNVDVHSALAVVWEGYHMNCADPADPTKPHPILGDSKVRQALWYGVDRESIIKELYPATDTSVAPTTQYPLSPWQNPNIKTKPYDPEKAKALLEEAGWIDQNGDGIRECHGCLYAEEGTPLHLRISTTSGKVDRERKQVIMQSQWKEIGVDLAIENYDSATLFGAYTEGGFAATAKGDIYIWAWVAGVDPSNYEYLHSSQIPSPDNPVGQNWYNWSDPEVDELTVAGMATMDQAERQKAYWKVDEILYDRGPIIFERVWTDLHADVKVANFIPNPTNQGHMWNCYQWDLEE